MRTGARQTLGDGPNRSTASRTSPSPRPSALTEPIAAGGNPEIPRLRRSLLLIAGAIGSVSALGRGLGEVRDAVDLFGPSPRV
ncbi:DUF5955 family protein [Streptomyces prasinus]|uniref:DUF5955 family protein n=1 Tax=Streptomyces prasinus TaxID=67345 RepID=UPI00099EDF07|nr:DUF5955 family protein [Streptomyces prasinus]